MTNQLIRAQPPLEFIQPALNPIVLQGCQALLPLWLRWKTNLTDIQASHLENLVHLYEQFQHEKVRFLLAFRHPSINDPYCIAYLLWRLVPQAARQQGIALQRPIHAHFIYDRGIPIWAGANVGWIYSRLGGTPIQRGKADLIGLRSARQLFAEGNYPLAAAPEGATNGHNEIVSVLEPGLSQLGFWCVDDLRKAKRTETVVIVPLGIQYFYETPPWEEINRLLTQLEVDSGLTPSISQPVNETTLYQRLFGLGGHLLSLMEEFYTEFYHQTLPPVSPQADNPNAVLKSRLQNLLNTALNVSEQYFNLSPTGSLVDRCRRLEQAGWDYIYREELKPSHPLSLVEKGLADRIAEEANLRIWHMRIVECFTAVTGYYVKEKPAVERFAETILLLWDCVTRIKGENSFFRPQIGRQRVKMTVGKPISISERWDDYKRDRRSAVANLTQDLQTALEGLIIRE